jgi:MYXO-CTERM domain-containing protein
MENNVFGANSKAKDNPSVVLITNGSFGDLDNDRVIDFVMPMGGFGAAKTFAAGGQRADFEHHVGAWNTRTRQYLSAYPVLTDDWQFFMNPIVADIDGDNLPEVISTSGGYWVRAWNAKGEEAKGWPKLTGQWGTGTPAVGDIDGDGKLEVVVGTRFGWLYAWKTQGTTKGRIDWPSAGHDNHNTRNVSTKLLEGISSSELPPADGGVGKEGGVGGDGGMQPPENGGCGGCAVSARPGEGTWFAALLLLVLHLSRRRRIYP